MKRMLSGLLALCLLLALLPVFAGPVQAADVGHAESCLQGSWYYDPQTSQLSDWSSAILVQYSGYNFIITLIQPRDELYTVYSVENDPELLYVAGYGESVGNGLYMYEADDSAGTAEGFYPVGVVHEGETVTLVYWKTENTRTGIQGTAGSFQDGIITIPDVEGTLDYPIPVLNSKNEICAIYYGGEGQAISLITDQDDFYGNSQSGTPEATEPKAPEQEYEPQSPGGQTDMRVEWPVDLPELEELYGQAIVQKKPSMIGTIVIAVLAAAAVALLAAVVVIGRKKKSPPVQPVVDTAEEGTELARAEYTGLNLLFTHGLCVSVTESLSVGRAPDNSLVIPKTANTVSGHHCQILVQNGAAYLRDLGSTNGTFINGRKLVTGQLVQLLPGMIVSLGGVSSPEGFTVLQGR